MFDQQELNRLIEAMRANAVTTLEVMTSDDRLRLVFAPGPIRTAALETKHATVTAKSAAIGLFLPRGKDDGLTELTSGAAVAEGEVLGFVCQGAVQVPVVSPANGRIVGEIPKEAALLGYGDPVFTVEILQ